MQRLLSFALLDPLCGRMLADAALLCEWARRLVLGGASQPSGRGDCRDFVCLRCPSKTLVTGDVVMALVMVVNVVVEIVNWLSGCLPLPVVVWVEWLPVVACGYLG